MAMTRLMARALLDAAQPDDEPLPRLDWSRRYGSHAINRLLLYRMIVPAGSRDAGYTLTAYGQVMAISAAAIADACEYAAIADDTDPTCPLLDHDGWAEARGWLEQDMCALTATQDGPVTVVVAQLDRERFEREVSINGQVVWRQTVWRAAMDPDGGSPAYAMRDAAAAAIATMRARAETLPGTVVDTLRRLATA